MSGVPAAEPRLRPRTWTWPPRMPLPDPADGPHAWLVRAPTTGVSPVRETPPSALSVLDAGERRRAAALRRPGARAAYVTAHAALRRLLGVYLGVPGARVPLIRLPCPGCGEPHGRPVLAGPDGAWLHFSLSHTGPVAMLAVAGAPVGVDVERVPAAGLAADAAAALHPADRAELAALPPEARPAAFARCWTRTEAMVKATGEGLSGPGLTAVRRGAAERPARVAGWRLLDIAAPPGHAAACALPVSRTEGTEADQERSSTPAR